MGTWLWKAPTGQGLSVYTQSTLDRKTSLASTSTLRKMLVGEARSIPLNVHLKSGGIKGQKCSENSIYGYHSEAMVTHTYNPSTEAEEGQRV